MLATFESLEKYWTIAVKEENKPPKAIPHKATVDGEKPLNLDRNKTIRIAIKAMIKEQVETRYGLVIERTVLEEKFPLEKITKAIVAPNVAASDTPKVEGEAIGLLRQYCIMAPDNVNPVPTSKEAITLLNLIFPIMIFAFLLPALKSPFNISRNSSPLESISKAKKKDTIKMKNNIPRATK